MANVKISALPDAAALDGTELVPIVQSAATVKTTTQDIANLGGGSGALKGTFVVQSSTITVAPNVGVNVSWDTPTIDTGPFWDVAHPTRFTAPVAGFYLMSCRSQFFVASPCFTYWLLNGSTLLFTENTNTGGNNYHAPGGAYYMAMNDYVELQLVQQSAGSVNMATPFFGSFVQLS